MTLFIPLGDPPGEPLLVESTSDTQLSPNGSLVFPNVQPHLQGHYTCRASNDIGQPLSKTVFLRVNGKPVGRPTRSSFQNHFVW